MSIMDTLAIHQYAERVCLVSEDYRVRGDKIRSRRQRNMWNQQQLADAVGMSKQSISRIETGRHRPYLSTVKRIADALGVDPGEFVEWFDVTEPENPDSQGSQFPGGARTERDFEEGLDAEEKLRRRLEADKGENGESPGERRT